VSLSFAAIGSASAQDESILVAVVGDIQCGAESPLGDDRCQSDRVRALIDARQPHLILMPGDVQYETGSPADFAAEFGPTWSTLASIIRPAPGNHEYRDGLAGYLGYFGESVTTNGQAFYGFGAGTWQGLSLDSNCDEMDCSPSGAQFGWASGELSAWGAIDPTGCSIAQYHHPLVTSYNVDTDGESRFAETFSMLANQGIDIVVAGHVHAYERFAPVDSLLQLSETGTVQFTVGTGGKSHYNPKGAPDVAAAFYTDSRYGVLFLRLAQGSYTFEFVDVEGNVVDKGEGVCR
jgi:alkaline phosphatase